MGSVSEEERRVAKEQYGVPDDVLDKLEGSMEEVRIVKLCSLYCTTLLLILPYTVINTAVYCSLW
jgi:hypothetical protein